jgi:hypothetical protein
MVDWTAKVGQERDRYLVELEKALSKSQKLQSTKHIIFQVTKIKPHSSSILLQIKQHLHVVHHNHVRTKKNVSYESGAKQWLNKKTNLKPDSDIKICYKYMNLVKYGPED